MHDLPDRPDGLLLTGGAVLTVDDAFTVHDPGWVHVVADRVAAVGPGSRRRRRPIVPSG